VHGELHHAAENLKSLNSWGCQGWCILQVFVCLWFVCDEVCGCFLKMYLFNIVFTPGCENLRLTSLYLSMFALFQDGLGISLGNYSIWAQSNNAFLRYGLSQNIYKYVPKPLAQGTQQQIVRYTSPKATMLWTMCLDDISSCHRQCCLYCWCWVLKRFGIVCV
jgi:hypothetical protein